MYDEKCPTYDQEVITHQLSDINVLLLLSLSFLVLCVVLFNLFSYLHAWLTLHFWVHWYATSLIWIFFIVVLTVLIRKTSNRFVEAIGNTEQREWRILWARNCCQSLILKNHGVYCCWLQIVHAAREAGGGRNQQSFPSQGSNFLPVFPNHMLVMMFKRGSENHSSGSLWQMPGVRKNASKTQIQRKRSLPESLSPW